MKYDLLGGNWRGSVLVREGVNGSRIIGGGTGSIGIFIHWRFLDSGTCGCWEVRDGVV